MEGEVENSAPSPFICPVGGARCLTSGEIGLAETVFGNAIDYGAVQIRRRKWFPLQPRNVTMAPRGHLHFHPKSSAYCDDFSKFNILRQGLLIHELTHVWQTQTRGSWYLVLNRHLFCRYRYSLVPGQPFSAYGIEQQAEIVKHAFWLRNGVRLAGVGDKAAYDELVRFPGSVL